MRRERSDEAHSAGRDAWTFTRRDLPYRLRIWISSTNPALDRAVAQVCRLASRCGCTEDRRTDLEIALREALANAIQHGNGRHAKRKVFLRCYAGPNVGIVIAVSFLLVEQLAGHIGLTFGLNPVVAACVPTLLFFALAVWMFRRVH